MVGTRDFRKVYISSHGPNMLALQQRSTRVCRYSRVSEQGFFGQKIEDRSYGLVLVYHEVVHDCGVAPLYLACGYGEELPQ